MSMEPSVYPVARSYGAMDVDGDWDKAAWAGVAPLIIGRHMGEEPEHRPGVLAKMAWDDQALWLIFRVEDRYVRAVARHDQDPVCRDSCVEFFFTPGSGLGLSYFNLEINCGGVMLFCWHPEGRPAVPVATEDMERVERAHSLPAIVEPEIEESVTWTVECRLPFEVIGKYCPEAIPPGEGVVWKANFYKCADASSHPHWLTWSLVDYPVPRFHMPEFFGILQFE